MLRVSRLLGLVVFAAVLFGSAQNVSAADIDSCSVLDTAGETYVLTQDITNSANTVCMNVTADNVTLDCNGYSIDGVYSSNTYGVYAHTNKNVTVTNCNITDWWYGVYMNKNFDSLVFKSNFTHNYYGVMIASSWKNNISDNLMDSVSECIYFTNSSYNSVSKNLIKNSDNGIALYSNSNENNLFLNIFEKSFGGYALYIYQSRYNLFRDSIINTTSDNIYHFASTDTDFLNVSLDKTKISVYAGAVYVKWYLDVRVLEEGGSPLGQANVTGMDKDNVTAFSELTNSSGYIERQNVTEFYQNFTGQFPRNSYSIKAEKTGYFTNQTLFNVTDNNILTIYLTGSVPSVEVKTYDMGLAEKSMFRPGRVVSIRALVTYTEGREYLENSTVLIKNNLGSVVVNKELMTNVSGITNGYVYEYNYTLPSDAEGLWLINVTAKDSFGGKGYDSLKIAVALLSLQVKLVLNSTSDRIYIPGTGERTFSALTTNEYSTPDHYYIASYSSDVLKSIVFSYMDPLSIFTEKGAGVYGIGTNQRFSNSVVFLVFSNGNWRNVDSRISSIEGGEFLSNPEPSFGFGLGKDYPFKIVLEYDKIDINRTLTIQKGLNRLVIGKVGVTGDKVNLEIKRG